MYEKNGRVMQEYEIGLMWDYGWQGQWSIVQFNSHYIIINARIKCFIELCNDMQYFNRYKKITIYFFFYQHILIIQDILFQKSG